MGDFNHSGTCWKNSTAGYTESWRFLLSCRRLLSDTRGRVANRGVLLDLVLTNKEGLLRNMWPWDSAAEDQESLQNEEKRSGLNYMCMETPNLTLLHFQSSIVRCVHLKFFSAIYKRENIRSFYPFYLTSFHSSVGWKTSVKEKRDFQNDMLEMRSLRSLRRS